MSDRVAQINELLTQVDDAAAWIANLWTVYDNQMEGQKAKWKELDAYLTATDTSTTSNKTQEWKNSTTLPKLTQLYDNLHTNYLDALFPNDKWLSWNAGSKDAADFEVAKSILGYMDNKLKAGKFQNVVDTLLDDYIRKGNAFAMPSFERRYSTKNDSLTLEYAGPKAIRISPWDIRFDPTAVSFDKTPKIVRSIKTLGDLAKLAQTNPEQTFWQDALDRRVELARSLGSPHKSDQEISEQYEIDGFGSLQEYYRGQYVEILEFYGDMYNNLTGELQINRMITVVDRSLVVRNVEMPTYAGNTPIHHVGWRTRPDNLWASGPLDNLVGLQYRLDHLENLKADAMDFSIHPMIKIVGEVEEFVWEPGGHIIVDENGDVVEMGMNLNGVINANTEIQLIEDRMELYAGAPREAMGIRTPGEKTAFEFDKLFSAASRIFQRKTRNFEIKMLEPLVNDMYEAAHRNMLTFEIIKTIDEDLGIEEFLEVSKEGLSTDGVIEPVGARHYAQQQQDLLSLSQLFQGPLGVKVDPHTSGKELTRLIDNVMNLRGYNVFSPNVAVFEQQETQRMLQQGAEDLQLEAEQGVVEGDGVVEGEEVDES